MVFLDGAAASGGLFVDGEEKRGAHFEGSPVYAKFSAYMILGRHNNIAKYDYYANVTLYDVPFYFVCRRNFFYHVSEDNKNFTGSLWDERSDTSLGYDILRMSLHGVTMPFWNGAPSMELSVKPLEEYNRQLYPTILC